MTVLSLMPVLLPGCLSRDHGLRVGPEIVLSGSLSNSHDGQPIRMPARKRWLLCCCCCCCRGTILTPLRQVNVAEVATAWPACGPVVVTTTTSSRWRSSRGQGVAWRCSSSRGRLRGRIVLLILRADRAGHSGTQVAGNPPPPSAILYLPGALPPQQLAAAAQAGRLPQQISSGSAAGDAARALHGVAGARVRWCIRMSFDSPFQSPRGSVQRIMTQQLRL